MSGPRRRRHGRGEGAADARERVRTALAALERKRWRDLVLLALERYSLDDHVLLDVISSAPAWRRMDVVVRSWLFGTLTAELMETIRVRDDTACITWLRIEQQFRGNREPRALRLDAEFHLCEQGDLSITDYCRKMKGMADDLGDLGEVHPRSHPRPQCTARPQRTVQSHGGSQALPTALDVRRGPQ